MTSTESALDQPLQDVADALSDFRNTQFQNSGNVFKRLISLFGEEPLAGFLHASVPPVDFDGWWENAQNSGGSMASSGALEWPIDRTERVAMQLELCNAIAKGDIQLISFVHRYCNPGSRNIDAHLRMFVDVILQPMIRDIKRLTMARPLPPVLFDAMGKLPESGDATLDSLLKEASTKFRDPAPASRRLAVERLWDAWERLKTLDDSSDKKLSVRSLLDAAAINDFRSILEEDARVLTKIGNDFHIRHFETNRAGIDRIEHYDYLFHRLFSLMYLLLFSRHANTTA